MPSAPLARLKRPEPGRAQHVPRELQVLLVVVDDQDERRFRAYLSAGERASRRSGHRRILCPCRSGSCSPRTTTSFVRASGGCSRRDPTSRSRPSAATSARCSPRSTAERPDVVVTDIRMPPGGADEGIQAAERLRETNPEIGVVVLSQYANPSYVLALLERGSAGRAYLLKERVKDLGAARGRDPRRRGGRLGDRSEGRRGAGGGERPRRGVAAQPADARASATCCARWPRGRTTRRSPRRSS